MIPDPAVVFAVTGYRGGRTGGNRFWADLIDRSKLSGLPVVCEDDSPPSSSIAGNPWALAIWALTRFAGQRSGVLVADPSSHGMLSLLLRRQRLRRSVRRVLVVHHLRESFRWSYPAYVRAATANENAVLRSAHEVIVHTEATRRAVETRGIDPQRLVVLRQGWRDAYPQTPVRELAADEPLRLLWIGADFRRKGLDLALRALADAHAPHPVLTVVGSPEGSAETRWAQDQARSLGVSERVRFLGAVENATLDSLWQSHDAYLLPSRLEGHGRAVDEALHRGLPVILGDLDVFRERLTDHEVRFVPHDPTALVTAFAELRDLELRRALASRGLARAATFPTWEETLDAHIAVFRAQLESTGEPGR